MHDRFFEQLRGRSVKLLRIAAFPPAMSGPASVTVRPGGCGCSAPDGRGKSTRGRVKEAGACPDHAVGEAGPRFSNPGGSQSSCCSVDATGGFVVLAFTSVSTAARMAGGRVGHSSTTRARSVWVVWSGCCTGAVRGRGGESKSLGIVGVSFGGSMLS